MAPEAPSDGDAPEEINPAWLQKGERVGLYEIERLVGSGGFGALYRAKRDGRSYALKIPLAKVADLSEEQRVDNESRIDREIGTLKLVSHPNIVRVRAHDRWPDAEKGYLYIVMDFVEGDQLYAWRAKTTPSPRRIVEVFRRLALALAEMHRVGIFHRDIKSANVLVRSADGEPIIVDFGIARPKSAYTVTREHQLLGTYTHWSPEYLRFYRSEQWANGEHFAYTPATDLYALGCMFYECVAGRAPHEAESQGEYFEAVLEPVVSPSLHNPKLPSGLDDVLLRLLAATPEERYQSGHDLVTALDALLESVGPGDAIWDSPLDVPARPTASSRTRVARGRSGSQAPSGACECFSVYTFSVIFFF